MGGAVTLASSGLVEAEVTCEIPIATEVPAIGCGI